MNPTAAPQNRVPAAAAIGRRTRPRKRGKRRDFRLDLRFVAGVVDPDEFVRYHELRSLENLPVDPDVASYCDHVDEFRALAFGRTAEGWAAAAGVAAADDPEQGGAIVVAEEHSIIGGLGSAVLEALRGVLARQGGDAASPPATAETPARDAARVLDGKVCVAADDHPVNLALVTHLLRDLGAEADGLSASSAGRASARWR